MCCLNMHNLKQKLQQQEILGWRVYFMVVVTVLLQLINGVVTGRSSGWTLGRLNVGVKRPGVMEPNIIESVIGGNIAINCSLSDANSSQIWFYENRSGRNITQPSPYIKISGPYNATLFIRNAAEQKSEYLCQVGGQAIGMTRVFVGTPPTNVTDFKCRVYDYEFMECNFTKPRNMLLTNYQLKYRFMNDTKELDCPLYHGSYCNITQDYLPTRDEYIFELIAHNKAGENIQEFIIHNHKIVIPSPLNVNITKITSRSVSLEWRKQGYSVSEGTYDKNLKYHITLYDNQSQPPDSREIVLDSERQVTLNDLYAYWPFVVSVRAKSNAVDDDDNMWSRPTISSFRTRPRRPDSAPDVPEGGFYIDNTETQLRLYWKEISIHHQNGPGFHYIIRELEMNNDNSNNNNNTNKNHSIIETKTNDTSVTFPWDNNYARQFRISSANAEGESDEYHLMRIDPSTHLKHIKQHYMLDEKTIAKVYHNSSYTLSWNPPPKFNDLLNYTVFWCLPKIELPNQCKGPIYYEYVDKTARTFTTEPQEADRSLNLAISANYRDFNKGMQWAQCSGDISSELMKMEIDVIAVNESSILIKWNTGSVCASILRGYNLSYWSPNTSAANTTTIELLREQQEYRNYTITDLSPFTTVCVNMSMYSSTKRGRSSDTKCLKTKETAPGPPLNLLAGNVTSKSADVLWEPPDVTNGQLTNYTIYWRKNPSEAFDKTSVSKNQTYYTLSSLNSYSNYEIYITAHTVKESEPSNRINVSTLIGIPSNPRNVNITENDSIIAWDAPLLPSGRLEFYIVALIRRSNDSREIAEAVSLVKGRQCRFHIPECYNNHYSYTLRVRAINVASADEYDHEIKPLSTNLTIDDGQIDQNFCRSDNKLDINSYEALWQSVNQQALFASPWSYSHQVYKCSGTPVFAYVIAIIMLSFIMTLVSYWLRSKYREMKNIEVILPEGLVDQVSKYKFAQSATHQTNLNDFEINATKKDTQLDLISRSSDCLVNFHCNNKKTTNIMQSVYKMDSGHNLDSLSSQHSDDNKVMEQYAPSLETTNEDFTSSSSSITNSEYSTNYNKSLLSYKEQEQQQYEQYDQRKDASEDTRQKNDYDYDRYVTEHRVPTSPGGYVTPNALLLASNLNNETERIMVPPSISLPPLMTNGYIQSCTLKQLTQPVAPPMTASIKIDDYVTPDDIEKTLKVASNIIPEPLNVPSHKLLASQHIINDSQELESQPQFNVKCENDNITTTTTTTTTSTATITSNENHKNSNSSNHQTINGYVTQRQLANYGTNMVQALAKEVHT